jgi:hypothetical protein
LVFEKNANIFAEKFGENILKIITSVSGWAKFRLLGECLLFGRVFLMTEEAQFFSAYFH